MRWLKNEWLQLLVLLLPFCAAGLLWDRLPDPMPIHWNARGEIDGYAGKPFATFFVPMLNVALAAVFYLLSFIDPKIQGSQSDVRVSFRKVFRIVRLVFSTFMSLVALTVLAIAAGVPLDMTRIMGIGSALLIGILGNFMSKIRPNYFVGVRTPWTLESPEIWVRTHRLAGRVMVVTSVLLLAATFAFRGLIHVWITVSLIILMALIPTVYSFVAYKSHNARASSM